MDAFNLQLQLIIIIISGTAHLLEKDEERS